MIFANDIVLIDESWAKVKNKLEVWRHALESKGFKLSRTKIEYLECKFSIGRDVTDNDVRLASHSISKREYFKYLRSIIQSNGNIDEDVTYHIRKT